MEVKEVVIPAWAVALLIPAFAGIVWWLVYLTRLGHENEKSIAVNSANDKAVGELIMGVQEKVKEVKGEVKDVKTEMVHRTEKIEDKVDKLFDLVHRMTKA